MACISIFEQKPAHLRKVLIYHEVNEWIIGYYDKRSGRFIGSVDGARIANPRWWKPLPEPPKAIVPDLHLTSSMDENFLNE
jgi:hypothetical protein